MVRKEINYRDLLAQARAMYFAMQRGSISYEKALNITKPLLKVLNKKVKEIARKHKIEPRLFKFQDLGRTL